MKAIIHLEENLNVKSGPKGETVSVESQGVLNIINTSSKTTIWGIDLKADYQEDIQDFSEEIIPHVEAGKEYTCDYKTKVEALLKINEIFDTNFDGNEVNPNNKDLVYNMDQSLAFKITIQNNFEFDLKSITLEKHFLPDTKDIRAIEPFAGEITVTESDRIVTWILSELKAGESASLTISSTCHPTNVQPYKTGIIICRCEADHILSSIVPTIDGECDNVDLAVEAIETSAPNQWKINFGLRNASGFEIFLKHVNIHVNGEEKYSEKPQEELETVEDEPIWKQSIIVESTGYPEITKSFDYYTLYDVTEHSIIVFEKENDQIYVLKTSATKYFDPPEVVTYAVTNLVATIDIVNTGTANVGRIEIEDTIPSYVEFHQISAETSGNTIEVDFVERPKAKPKPVVDEEREIATFEALDQDSELAPEPEIEEIEKAPEDITTVRKYHYIISDLDINPGQIIKLKAIGIANKPRGVGSQSATVEIKAYATKPTKPHISIAEMEGKEPTLLIEFKKRSYKLTSIFTKKEEGDFEIKIPITNSGEMALENVIITQPIFNAQYSSHTPPTVDVKIEGSNVKCHIKRINTGETITLTLHIRADGPVRQQQATIRIED